MVIATMTCISGICDEPVHEVEFDVNPTDTDQIYDMLTLYAERGATDVKVKTDEGDLVGILVEMPEDGTNVPARWRRPQILALFAFNPN